MGEGPGPVRGVRFRFLACAQATSKIGSVGSFICALAPHVTS
jgi:hypothetical protein